MPNNKMDSVLRIISYFLNRLEDTLTQFNTHTHTIKVIDLFCDRRFKRWQDENPGLMVTQKVVAAILRKVWVLMYSLMETYKEKVPYLVLSQYFIL